MGTGQNDSVTDQLFLRDAYLRRFEATVTAVDGDGGRVALDRTAFYPTGGGQPHDTGTLAGRAVTDVRKEGDQVWHTLDGARPSTSARWSRVTSTGPGVTS